MTFLLIFLLRVTLPDLTGDRITGTVRDATTRETLPFTSVAIAGKHQGTVANAEGYFALDRRSIQPGDTIIFSHVGYVVLKLSAAELEGRSEVLLKPAVVNLSAVSVYSRPLTATEIILRVKEHYPENHPQISQKQQIFLHKFEKTPFPESNQIVVKGSDFTGLDKQTMEELLEKLPEEFVEYQDALIEVYSDGEEYSILPIEAISMEEGSQRELAREIESRLGTFFEDIETSHRNPDIYYKFRTGIFSMKTEQEGENDSLFSEAMEDSLHYHVGSEFVKTDILFLLRGYADIESKNLEFLTKPGRYRYELKGVTIYNDELVYEIAFTPQRAGLFEGSAYISVATFAVLQLDFAFAPGKDSENIQLLGFGHSMKDKQAQVLFEKTKTGYQVKYINVHQHESASIDRKFSILKKERRFLYDKTLSEIRLAATLSFDIHTSWELLVINREARDSHFEFPDQPQVIRFRKEYAYSPEMWEHSVISPTGELKKYQRKQVH